MYPAAASSALNRSENLFCGIYFPIVFVGGITLGILLYPKAMPISSAISHGCKTSALVGGTSTTMV